LAIRNRSAQWNKSATAHADSQHGRARKIVLEGHQWITPISIAQGNAPKEPTLKMLEYKEMDPFFVKGESDGP
jgi:hypothetical protein